MVGKRPGKGNRAAKWKRLFSILPIINPLKDRVLPCKQFLLVYSTYSFRRYSWEYINSSKLRIGKCLVVSGMCKLLASTAPCGVSTWRVWSVVSLLIFSNPGKCQFWWLGKASNSDSFWSFSTLRKNIWLLRAQT